MTPTLTADVLRALRADHRAKVEVLQRQCRDLGDQLDAERRRSAKLEGDLAAMRDLIDERAEAVYYAAIEWFRDDDGAALAEQNIRLRAEVARLNSMLADLGGPQAATSADCGSPGRSVEVAPSEAA